MKKNKKRRQSLSLHKLHYSDIFIFLFLFLLPTQFGKHFFFSFSYLSGIRIDYLAPTVYLIDLLLIPLLIMYRKSIAKFFNNKLIFGALGLFIINIFFSSSPFISLYRFLKIIELLFIFAIFAKERFSSKILLIGFLANTVFQAVLVILQLILKQSVQGLFYFFGERIISLSQPGIAKTAINGVEILRPYGTFSHPNSLGGFYLLVYTFFLFLNVSEKETFLKKLLLFLSTLLVFFSFSKTVIITYLFINVFHWLFRTKGEITCGICEISKAVILAVLGFIFLAASSDPASIDKRVELMNQSFVLIQKHPLFGVGLGTFTQQVSTLSTKYLYVSPQPVHNIFLLFIAEVGIFTSTIIGYFLLRFFWNSKKNALLIGCFLIIVATGFADHYWLTLEQNWLLMGVLMGASFSEEGFS